MVTIDVPMLAGAGWLWGALAVVVVVMVIKWIVDILP